MSTEPASFTLTEAAQVTGRSRTTIRRYLDADKFPNAWQDNESGEGGPPPWRIPVGDLLRVGLEVRPDDRRSSPTSAGRVAQRDAANDVRSYEIEPVDVVALREALAVATALADERARTIETLRQALADALATVRALAPSAVGNPSAEHKGQTPAEPASREG